MRSLFKFLALLLLLFINTVKSNSTICECRCDDRIRLVSATGSSKNSAGSNQVTSGRLEVFVNSAWGTVCNSKYFGKEEALAACRQLGFNVSSPHYSPTADTQFPMSTQSTPIWFERLNCGPGSRDLFSCIQGKPGDVSHTCTHSNDVLLSCSERKKLKLSKRTILGIVVGSLVLLFFLALCLLLLFTVPTALKRRARESKGRAGDGKDDPASAPLLANPDSSNFAETNYKQAPLNPNLSSTPEDAMPFEQGVPYLPPPATMTKAPTPPPLITYYEVQEKNRPPFAPDLPTSQPPVRPPVPQYPPPPTARDAPPALNTYYMVRQPIIGPPPGPYQSLQDEQASPFQQGGEEFSGATASAASTKKDKPGKAAKALLKDPHFKADLQASVTNIGNIASALAGVYESTQDDTEDTGDHSGVSATFADNTKSREVSTPALYPSLSSTVPLQASSENPPTEATPGISTTSEQSPSPSLYPAITGPPHSRIEPASNNPFSVVSEKSSPQATSTERPLFTAEETTAPSKFQKSTTVIPPSNAASKEPPSIEKKPIVQPLSKSQQPTLYPAVQVKSSHASNESPSASEISPQASPTSPQTPRTPQTPTVLVTQPTIEGSESPPLYLYPDLGGEAGSKEEEEFHKEHDSEAGTEDHTMDSSASAATI